MASKAKKRSCVSAVSDLAKEICTVAKKRRSVKNESVVDKKDTKSKKRSIKSAGSSRSESPVSSKERNKTKPKTKSTRKKSGGNKEEPKDTKGENISVDEMNVEQLLALGEQSYVDQNSHSTEDDFEGSSDSDSDMSDFEEVKNGEINEPVIPKEGVNIVLEVPSLNKKSKKKGIDLEAHLKRQMNRVRKDLQLLMHKVHVLCWLAHLRFVNTTLNDTSLMESCVSLVKSKNLYPKKYADMTYLEGILKWFHKNINLKKNSTNTECTGGLLDEIEYQIKHKEANSSKVFIFMFIILLRVLGLHTRVVMNFQVLPVKPSLLELYGDVIKARSEKLKAKDEEKEEKNESEKGCNSKTPKSNDVSKPSKKENTKKNSKAKDKSKVDDDDELESKHFRLPVKCKKIKVEDELNTDDPKIKPGSSKKSNKTGKKQPKKNANSDEDEDDDFTVTSLQKKSKPGRKSNVGSEEKEQKKDGSDVWVEVFLEAEEKWITVDVPRQKIHCVGEIYSRMTHPVAYIIACNNDNTLKDVTKRYVPNWHSDTRKKRVDEEWWNDTMQYFLPPKTAREKEEDEDINRQLHDRPLPSSISEFKDHPLYALKRHLLKFEAIYPPDAPTLGFVRGEAVYARECVATLHSREMWYKQARLVRLKEEPYKIVKARPKYDKMTGEMKKDLPLELFGRWQTEDYIPPIATGGKVPRNEYGNVDLFKPCMLPIGTVHLQIPALNRIAKKLDIDCAPATVGFEFHSGGSHPVFDGFVVCEEFKDVLLDAWNKEIDESAKREEEKKEKRVYKNWRRLIRGLLIREKLKIKYAFGENSDDESHPEGPTGS